MDVMTDFLPIFEGVVEKALRETGKSVDEVNALKSTMKNIFQPDASAITKINDLVKNEVTASAPPATEAAPAVPPEADEALPKLRAFVRPSITLLLTGAFIFLVISPVAIQEIDMDSWDKAFVPFMAVFNLLLGFWFGERTALKVPGGKQAKEVAAKASEDAAKALANAKHPHAQG